MSQSAISKPRTVPQAAEDLSLSIPTIRAWIGARKIGVIRLGRAVRIPPSEIDRLLRDGFTPAERNR